MLKIANFIQTGILISLFLIVNSCRDNSLNNKSDNFSFVFMTDIHLQHENNACEGFRQAIDSINALSPDFVITGGDLIMDALGQRYNRADSLYNLYRDQVKILKMPVYNTMGNHEIYGLYASEDSVKNNPEYAEKMFEKRLGRSYYSFIHKGWKFMIINSVEDNKKHGYIGWIDSTQMKWIQKELEQTDKGMPIVLSTHIPFITVFMQKYYGSTLKNDSSLVVANSKEVIDLFKNHNLRLVLQGHLHAVEDIYVDGIHFITGGSICGKWWHGPNMGFEEGFVNVKIKGNDLSWKYIDYGWNVKDN